MDADRATLVEKKESLLVMKSSEEDEKIRLLKEREVLLEGLKSISSVNRAELKKVKSEIDALTDEIYKPNTVEKRRKK